MNQVTRAQTQAAMDLLINALDKYWAKDHTDVGGWLLDHNPSYGGSVIEEIVNPQGAVTHPMGSQRRMPREFCDTIHFALKVLRLI